MNLKNCKCLNQRSGRLIFLKGSEYEEYNKFNSKSFATIKLMIMNEYLLKCSPKLRSLEIKLNVLKMIQKKSKTVNLQSNQKNKHVQ